MDFSKIEGTTTIEMQLFSETKVEQNKSKNTQVQETCLNAQGQFYEEKLDVLID